MDIVDNQTEKLGQANKSNELEKSVFSGFAEFGFELITYGSDLFNAIFLKTTGLGKCKQKYCNHGDYCELSRKFLAHKWFVEYFCKIEGYGPDEDRIRDGGLFHKYVGCSPKKEK